MKTTLITTIAVATLLLAGAASAQDFHPILDADYLSGQGIDEIVGAQLNLDNFGPHSDADWDGEGMIGASTLVSACFHDLLGADILGGQAAVCNAEIAAVTLTP